MRAYFFAFYCGAAARKVRFFHGIRWLLAPSELKSDNKPNVTRQQLNLPVSFIRGFSCAINDPVERAWNIARRKIWVSPDLTVPEFRPRVDQPRDPFLKQTRENSPY